MTIEESAKDLLRKLRDAWVMRVVDADERMLFECKYALQAQRDDMREKAADRADGSLLVGSEIAKEIRALK